MSISGINSSSALAALQQLQNTQQSSTANSAQPAATSSSSSNPAYTLALGQQQSENSLLGYGSLGKRINQAAAALGGIDDGVPKEGAKFGNGAPIQQSYSLDVQQLAQAQVVTSSGFPNSDQPAMGTGTLIIQPGNFDPAGNTFTDTGSPVQINITDGSLNGVAAAINSANAGMSAAVIQGTDGSYELQVTGQSGADNAFQMSGINTLAYDPTSASFTGMQDAQTAQDATYSVNGGATQTSPTNTNITVASGVTASLTATGPMSVNIPLGSSQAVGAAQTLVNTVNALLGNLGQMTASGGQLNGDTGVAGNLGKALDQAAIQNFSGSSLANIGISIQADGTFALDSGKLQSAYATDPSGTRDVLDQASSAIRQTLTSNAGASGQVKGELKSLVASIMQQMPSLESILDGSSSGSSSNSAFSGMMGSTDQTNQLMAAMGQTGQSSTQSNSLLSALSGGGTGSTNQTDQLLSALGQNGQNQSQTQSLLSALSPTGTSSNPSSSQSDSLLAALQGIGQTSA